MTETTTYQITEIKPIDTSLMGPSYRGRQGWCGTVEQGRSTFFVSKWNGETEWIIDGQFVNNCPIFYNGLGSRVTILKTFTDKRIGSDLDREVQSRTGW